MTVWVLTNDYNCYDCPGSNYLGVFASLEIARERLATRYAKLKVTPYRKRDDLARVLTGNPLHNLWLSRVEVDAMDWQD